MTATWLTIIGLILSLITLAVGVSFRMGRSDARIESLEEWRRGIRIDMHEISDQIQEIGRTLAAMKAMLEERTERRSQTRPS